MSGSELIALSLVLPLAGALGIGLAGRINDNLREGGMQSHAGPL